MTIDELKSIVLELPLEERARLASDLLLSLDDLSEQETEHLWLEEASRRDAEVDAGKAELIPGDQVFAEARARRPRDRLVPGDAAADLDADPGERPHLRGRHPEVVAELQSVFDAWRASLPKPKKQGT